MANVISTTIVMLTRLLDMRIVARSCSDLFTNEYAREHFGVVFLVAQIVDVGRRKAEIRDFTAAHEKPKA